MKYFERQPRDRQASLRTWEAPPRNAISPPDSIFSIDFLSVVIDEVHLLRNQSKSFVQLIRHGHASVVMTATPLHTSPDDLFNLGALMGIPSFADDDGLKAWREQMKLVKKAKAAITRDDWAQEHDVLISAPIPALFRPQNQHEKQQVPTATSSPAPLVGAQSDDSASPSPSSTPPAPPGSPMTVNRPEVIREYEKLTVDAITRMGNGFEGHIIRRTPGSLDFAGKPLNELRPYISKHIFLDPTGVEIQYLSDAHLAERSK